MRKTIVFLIIILQLSFFVHAQELFCNVSVNSSQISGSDKTVFETMQTAIREFLNNRKWTNYNYRQEEKIECTFFFNITERSSDVDFKGTLQVQSRRPIFNTSYNSPMLNLLDKDISFKYIQNQTLDYDDNNFYSNLTALIAYYAYIIIGLDFDSYSMKAGVPYYTKAQNIVTLAQNTADKGWKSFESRKNRYWLVENLLNDSYGGFRECLYFYHLKGFDNMKENMVNGTNSVITAMEKMQYVVKQTPNLYYANVFMDTKRDEIISLFSQAAATDKPRIVNILKDIDPAHSNDYNTKILNVK
ncbi:MAG: DUF4835 family protein [Bacteroidales bacterium]|jgi:hypothetical protein|nr:DUF4835 family protein [Bacteroidales bacterium]MDD4215236.1 DUF4835 family protein [Bacteroidales bacterium]